MLRGNLSTRPFYNERLATLAIVAVALVAALLTVFNASELVRLSSQRRAAQARIDADQSETERTRAATLKLQESVDRRELGRLADSTHEANAFIDQRTFSWTGFFRLIEKTLPFDVRIVAITPRVEKDTLKVAIGVIGRSLADVATFIEALRGTGAFYDVAAASQEPNDDGTYRATVEATYLSVTSEPPAAASTSSGPASTAAQPAASSSPQAAQKSAGQKR